METTTPGNYAGIRETGILEAMGIHFRFVLILSPTKCNKRTKKKRKKETNHKNYKNESDKINCYLLLLNLEKVRHARINIPNRKD